MMNTEQTTQDENTVILFAPLTRGDTLITEVQLIKPNAGALRGARLYDLCHSDVDALLTVLPRITHPALTGAECNRLDPADLIEMGGKVIGFLSPKSAP